MTEGRTLATEAMNRALLARQLLLERAALPASGYARDEQRLR